MAKVTERLYYQDAFLKTFAARVVERTMHGGHWAAVLDRTAFYPTGGGQPNDRGRLGHAPVVDVIEREADGAVVHVLDLPADAETWGKVGDEITGEVDWHRRFDLMQQHTGQHILSQAFVRVADADTIGFHLTDDTLTIDVNKKDLAVEQVEKLANQIVFEDRAVAAEFVSADELARLPLRKPPQVENNIRIVQVEGFDWSACGGTHVARTGQVGLIKVVKTERMSDGTRVEFCCGGRALADYARKHQMLSQLATNFSIGYAGLDQAVSRMQANAQDLHKRLVEAESRLLKYEALELAATAEPRGDTRLIARTWPERDPAHLRALAKQIAASPRTLILLGAGGAQPMFVFARSADLTVDMVPLVRGAIEHIGGKGGGGKPDFAQGGGPPATEDQVRAAVQSVSQWVS